MPESPLHGDVHPDSGTGRTTWMRYALWTTWSFTSASAATPRSPRTVPPVWTTWRAVMPSSSSRRLRWLRLVGSPTVLLRPAGMCRRHFSVRSCRPQVDEDQPAHHGKRQAVEEEQEQCRRNKGCGKRLAHITSDGIGRVPTA